MSENARDIELEQFAPALSNLGEAMSFSSSDGAIVSASDLSTRIDALRGPGVKAEGSCSWSGWGN